MVDDPGQWQRKDQEQLRKALEGHALLAAATVQPTPPRPLHMLIVHMQAGVVAPDAVVLIVAPQL